MDKIPLCDLKLQYKTLRTEILGTIDSVFSESAFIKGKYVKTFEQQFKKDNNMDYGISCANGTAAISLALEALRIGQGDEVILPSHTFIATAEAVRHVGATPVFVDIKANDYTIDSTKIEEMITNKTKAIVPVHIYGTPCDMDEIVAVAQKNNLKIIEDCAQSHFAKYNDWFVGSFGDAATFSFYPGKNLGAYGDAGFVLCKLAETEELLKRLSDHGRLSKFDHDIVGYNQRCDSVQAAILSVKMKYIHQWTKKRQAIAEIYDEKIGVEGFKVINFSKNKNPVYHVYCVEVSNREALMERLNSKGILCGIHYPLPVHKLFPFEGCTASSMEITEKISPRIVSLPIFPEMTPEQVEIVSEAFLNAAQA